MSSSAAAAESERDVLSNRRAFGVLILTLLLVETLPIAFAGVALAIRAIGASLGTTNAPLVLTVLLLAGGAMQPMAGKLADRFGRSRVLLGMCGCYIVGSIVCALAPNLPLLLAGRVLQAAIWAVPAVCFAIFRDHFPARLLPIAVGMLATGLGIGLVVTPVLCGLILGHGGYRAIFWMSAIYAFLVAIPLAKFLPRQRPRTAVPLDWIGMVLLVAGVLFFLLAVSRGGRWGWLSVLTAACVGVALLLLATFWWWINRTANPFLNPALLRVRTVQLTLVAAFLLSFITAAHTFLLPQLLEAPRILAGAAGFGMTATAVSLWTIPQGLCAAIAAPFGGWLCSKKSPWFAMVLSASTLSLSMLLMCFAPQLPLTGIVAITIIEGVGFGFFYAAVANLMMESLPRDITALGTGLMSCVESIGNAIAIAVTGAILMGLRLGLVHGAPLHSARSFAWAYGAAAATGLLALVALSRMRHGRQPVAAYSH